ncbi:bola-like protein [Ceraceosorus guamensis]|uniref:Bola-like protein n=1 Tax=Ceraceosorus guamensis TaxID=1522189 RepID=A0A316VVG1_9BASI|nr:bola-like protein [Ceraceosorus guamensis]PWN40928.1 bola-like protein [Ceraceosorus guamensis]
MVSQAELEAAIRAKVDGVTALVVSDVSGGCGQAYDVIIVSPIFEGLATLKRHRLVNDLLKDQIAELHAFSQKTFTPKQYEEQGAKAVTVPADVPSTAQAPAPSSTLQGLSPAASGKKSHHRSTSSISVPELTLTTDHDDLVGGPQSGSRPLTPGHQGPSHGPLQDSQGRMTSSASISNLHLARISSVEFWDGLRAFLEGQFLGPQGEAGSASPNTNGRTKGEAEMSRIFEDVLSSQRSYLTASDIAKIRDGTGMTGQGGV